MSTTAEEFGTESTHPFPTGVLAREGEPRDLAYEQFVNAASRLKTDRQLKLAFQQLQGMLLNRLVHKRDEASVRYAAMEQKRRQLDAATAKVMAEHEAAIEPLNEEIADLEDVLGMNGRKD